MAQVVPALKQLLALGWQDVINLIWGHKALPPNTPNLQAIQQLRQAGIATLPGYWSAEKCAQYRQGLLDLAAAHPQSVTLPNGVKIDHRNQGSARTADQGMVDIFYVEKAFTELQGLLHHPAIMQILQQATGQQVVPFRLNAYVNRGVQGTRGFHIDVTHPVVYKAFIYLTDVLEPAQGPYTFVHNSHRLSGTVYRNLLGNMFKNTPVTDVHTVPQKQVQPCLAPQGTLIISSQNAIHRGAPQQPGHERVALVLNYLVLSPISHKNAWAKARLKEAQAIKAPATTQQPPNA